MVTYPLENQQLFSAHEPPYLLTYNKPIGISTQINDTMDMYNNYNVCTSDCLTVSE